jgi:hypothetical protein
MTDHRFRKISVGLGAILFSLGISGGAIAAGGYPLAADGYNNNNSGELTGNYTVPAPQDLSSVASFKICYQVTTDTDGKLILRYHLPQEIVGANKAGIELKQSGDVNAGFIPFRGMNGSPDSANCRKHGNTLKCFVAYPGLDTSGSDDYVKDHYTDDLPQRLQVASLFSADPVGVVYVELTPTTAAQP